MLTFSVVHAPVGPSQDYGLDEDIQAPGVEEAHQYPGDTLNQGERPYGDARRDEDTAEDNAADVGVKVKRAGLTGLKVAIDFDGTLTLNPRAFRRLIDRLVKAGARVYLLTGRSELDRGDVDAFVALHGMRFAGMYFYPLPYRHDWIAWDIHMDARVGKWKASVLKDLGVDVVIDDNPVYVAQIVKAMPGVLALMPYGGAQ